MAGFAVRTLAPIGPPVPMVLLLPIVLFGLFYVFLILPKQRELKRHNALVGSLAVGDEVMSGSGLYGTLTAVDTDTVRLRIAPGVEVTLARRAVAARVEDPAAGPDVSAAEAGELGTGEDADDGAAPESGASVPTPDAGDEVDR